MAGNSSQPPIVFSRDLKCMLDSRHAAAPLRRSTQRGAVAIAIAATLAIGTWSGMRMLGTTEERPAELLWEPALQSAPAVQDETAHKPEYTQPEDRVSKRIEPQPAAGADPQPAASPDPEPLIEWKSHSVRRGDTLGKIFKRFSIDIALAGAIVKHEMGAALKRILPEHEMYFGFNSDGELVRLRYELTRLKELLIRFKGPELASVSKRGIPTDTRERGVGATIGSSLFVSASEAGLSDRLIMQLISIFGWDIDFALDVRSGDRFSVLYEEMFRDGERIGTGDILAAEFVNRGEVFHAVRYIDDQGRKEYFDLEGNNLRGTFLKTPMHVSRVTSGFSKSRYHPVLKEWRAHRGVDYGAPAGTPVLATGNGRVHSMGRNSGYGNVVVLKHGGHYSTLYAHLSRFAEGLERGARVQQGDIVGYVGSTGLATGPHLHYEFRVNGEHRNPLTYETPKAPPVAGRYREEFLTMARERIARLEDIRAERLASR